LQGAWNEKIFKIDISEQELLSTCQYFRDLLGKDSVIAGRTQERAKALLGEPARVSETNKVLPTAWLGLWNQPDDLPDEFFEAICQRVESLYGYQTTREQVVEFIAQNRPELASPKLPATKSVDNIARHRDAATKRGKRSRDSSGRQLALWAGATQEIGDSINQRSPLQTGRGGCC
jgi:hypothetical protein